MEFLPDFTDFMQSTTSIVFWSFAFIQLFWLVFFYLRLIVHKDKEPRNELPPVSVLIVARNEEDNIFEYLPFIMEQDYPEFEVIVVNHQSIDNTEFILRAFQERYSHLKIINIKKDKHLTYGKKLPLTIGIKGATYEHLILTDADCKPSSDQWLRRMAGQFSEQTKLVLGYGPLRKTKGFLNRIIRLDTTFIALNYLSFAKAGAPYMGVGRNLAYTKTLFEDNKGFKSHYSIPSGDDDLFVQEVAQKRNYSIVLSPESFCYSEAKDTWGKWYLQKSRHYTTSGSYSVFKKLLLGIYPLTLILFYLSFFTLLKFNWINFLNLGVLSFVLILKWIILGISFKRLEQKGFIIGILFWDLFYALITPILFYTSAESNNTQWR